MNILFISRTYHPGDIGGMEKQNCAIYKQLSKDNKVDLLMPTNKKLRKILLPVFFVIVLIKSLFILRKYDIVLLGDGVLGGIGYILKLFSKKPVVCIVHGLDLVYPNFIYQKLWVRIFIRNVDKLIAVGNETIKEGVLRGIPESKFVFVPNGVVVKRPSKDYSRKDLEKLIGREIRGGVLLTLGRLIKRKGVVRFLEEVVGNLSKDTIYIIAGQGREEQNIIAAINTHKLQDRVFYLGRVSEKEKELLFCTADIFVQPNIRVDGDLEGFGLVVLEAASYGLPVIASKIEGLKDAIQDGKNGILVEERDSEKYLYEIKKLLENDQAKKQFGIDAKQYVEKYCSWENIAKEYLRVFEGLIK